MSNAASDLLPDGLEPARDIARLFPPQGGWSEEEYLCLPGNHLTEFDQGRIEVLTMPSELHQLLVAALYRALLAFVEPHRLGTALFAPFPSSSGRASCGSPMYSSCALSMPLGAAATTGWVPTS